MRSWVHVHVHVCCKDESKKSPIETKLRACDVLSVETGYKSCLWEAICLSKEVVCQSLG